MPKFVGGDYVSLVYTVGLLVVAAGILFTLYRLFTQLISTVVLWMLLGLTLASCYSYRSELHDMSKWFFAHGASGHAIPDRQTAPVSAQTREILESMRRSMARL